MIPDRSFDMKFRNLTIFIFDHQDFYFNLVYVFFSIGLHCKLSVSSGTSGGEKTDCPGKKLMMLTKQLLLRDSILRFSNIYVLIKFSEIVSKFQFFFLKPQKDSYVKGSI